MLYLFLYTSFSSIIFRISQLRYFLLCESSFLEFSRTYTKMKSSIASALHHFSIEHTAIGQPCRIFRCGWKLLFFAIMWINLEIGIGSWFSQFSIIITWRRRDLFLNSCNNFKIFKKHNHGDGLILKFHYKCEHWNNLESTASCRCDKWGMHHTNRKN